jgi:hypothetical protein
VAVVSVPPPPSGVMFNSLEASGDDDFAFVEQLANAIRLNSLDAGLGEGRIGQDANLIARQTDGRFAQCLDGHGHERDRLLLARGQQHVHFTRGRMIADLTGQFDQVVGLVAASADNHHHLVAGPSGVDGPLGG